MKKLVELSSWQALQQHYQTIVNHSIREWFDQDPERFSHFSLQFDDILFDFSKNHINQETLILLENLAKEVNLSDSIQALFSGSNINFTENRPALHTALRDRQLSNLMINGHNVMPDIHNELKKMQILTENVRNDVWRGATGKPIRDIVNIGIGGSHLGPLMVTHALMNYSDPKLHCYFISNMDGSEIHEVLKKIDPEKTLFIISSKSFTTIETLSNARLIQQWLKDKLNNADISSHFIAVTQATEKARQFGIPEAQIFSIWDWVGGRYSVWSAIGLPIALMIGMENFYEFLDGAHEMDQHFRETPFNKNIPVLLGLLGIWYINFFGCGTQAIIPYAYELNFFRDYIQQADMESNGKTMTRSDLETSYKTGPIIWGEQGCDSQHSFFQLLHQSPHRVPVDFILACKASHFPEQQDKLVASAFSQAEALMRGRSYEEIFRELKQAGFSEKTAEHLARHKMIPGNRSSNALFLKKITPRTLGMLIALYEHKIFVQGMIWNINSFDQWGVELGKQLLPDILNYLKNSDTHKMDDSSTQGLVHFYLRERNAE
ncbi:MAG TPA: glucose-6-phosphate isomerase [Gammaproteobacteria bacterium]|nr:glucose-6-phosphate isomerase [Gammaproteobacteria bacterium]